MFLRLLFFVFSLSCVGSVLAENTDHQIRILYVVPSDVEPNPDYMEAVVEMVERTQEFYLAQLGRTYSIAKNPMVTVFRSAYTSEAITSGRASGGTSTTNFNAYHYLSSVVRNHFREDFYEQKQLFLGLMDVNVIGGGVGGGGIAQITRWHLDAYIDDPYAMGVQTIAHEIGHAFGLPHTPDSMNRCVAQYETVTQPMHSIMRHVAPGNIMTRQFMDFEKRLLMDEDYVARGCLIYRNGRPHPSAYLTELDICNRDADTNWDGRVGLDDLSLVLSLWGVCEEGSCGNADITCDGMVDLDDLSDVLINWE